MPTTKGENVESWCPSKVFPFFPELQVKVSELPEFSNTDHNPFGDSTKEVHTLWRSLPETQRLLRRTQNKNGEDVWSSYTILSTIALALSGVTSIKDSNSAEAQEEEEETNELACEAWTWIQDRLTWREFQQLHRHVQHHLCIVSAPHPIETYAAQTVPFLSKDHVVEAVNLLGMESKFGQKNNANSTNSSTGSTMALRLSQLLKDEFLPQTYGILFEKSSCFRHACLPTAALELASPSRVDVIALYDINEENDDDTTICSLPLDGGGEMAKEARRRCAKDGPCLLCQQQRQESSQDNLPWKPAVRLGHYWFQQGQYRHAQSYYHRAIEQNSALSDIRHALGALQLAQGKFLDAQITWKNQAAQMMGPAQTHSGIELQLKKQQSYKYLETLPQQPSPTQNYQSQSHFDHQCFVTPMLPAQECQRIIQIANQHGNWTTGRHYAVPTNDIPVHDVPELLQWFQPWFENECAPLLMQQFKVDARLYVHDAFVVRYQGVDNTKQTNNHLPCHLDECTHSFVICLNDNFEGGGTYFHDYNTVLWPKVGEVVTFKGDTLRHGGDAVKQGTRYILAAFLYLDRRPNPSPLADSHNNQQQTLQPLFRDSKKQKTGFSFGFDL